ncbi:heat shock protein HspQ [Sulfidibacter corallicola]|uniref:Heat shock protein HspQ n=1 Tax=Sulfidibacter corallicola TaxID=2818388 RepID=A0A8A4U018_SULCO|nr:heat shock protein HspQ [Sulfidibacter corallicola]QTD52095.1 heat shock protein HspQ [Sulfidibacter corallicola]
MSLYDFGHNSSPQATDTAQFHPDAEQLKKFEQLVKLLDAESEGVREMVRQELLGFGDHLPTLAAASSPDLSPEQQYLLHELLNRHKSMALRGAWHEWAQLEDPNAQLEAVLGYFAQIQETPQPLPPLSHQLDYLARCFRNTGRTRNVMELNQFLFAEGRLRGAQTDYYNPLHGNLSWVIQNGRGLPISLVCVFILAAHRLDLIVEGFNLPRHFLAKATVNGNLMLFDCFNNGKILSGQEISALTLMPNIDIHELLSNPPSAGQIAQRVLRNLINAYSKSGNLARGQTMQNLLEELNQMPRAFFMSCPRVSSNPQFRRGQLVRHGRYGYRGVVVEYDERCQADEAWYRANKTQPDKNQPWYHVLVHGSNVTTYAAQTSLIPDYSGAEVIHPLVDVYFDKFTNGFYLRNDQPWREDH